jgi:excisionase family DNA binding protein
MTPIEQAAAFAIKQAKNRGLTAIGPDELLLGCLQTVSRFGVISLGSLLLDLEELGIVWIAEPEKAALKVAYSPAVVAIFDLAARIARSEEQPTVRIEHLLAAFAREESGLMGELKRRHGITSATWRAAVAHVGSSPAASAAVATQPSPAPEAPATPDFLTPEAAAEALGIHVQTLRAYVRSGKLPALRLAGERAIRIRRADLEVVMEPLVPQSTSGL